MPLYSDIFAGYTKNNATGVDVVEDRNSIEQSMKNIILTKKGERINDPLFGTNIQGLLFEKMNNFIANEIMEEIYFSIENYEPRVVLDEVKVDLDYRNKTYKIDIEYSIKKLKKSFNLLIDLELQG